MFLKMAPLICLACVARIPQAAEIEIGWAERDVTPELGGKKVALAGLYYVREATNVHSRLKFTCCVMRKGGEHVLMGSLDTVSGWDPFTRKLAARVHERIPEVNVENVFVGCPHVHSAPYLRPCYTEAGEEWAKRHPGFLSPDEYADFVLGRAADAFVEAWANARPGSVARAFGSARIGHCRIALYRDGTSEMYGDARRDDFIGMLEGEDDGVELLFTRDASGKKTGVFVNVACPSQIMEQTYEVSADLAGATREKLARAYGADFHAIYQLGAAGDQSPRDLVRPNEGGAANGWNSATVDVLSDRLAACVKAAAASARPCPPVLSHRVRKMRLPLRRVTEAEVAAAKSELERLEAKWPGTSAWDDYLREVHHYERTGARLPFDSKLHPYAVMDVDRAVIARGATQDRNPTLEVESHVVRIGDVAFVTNPFELYLAFGQVVKSRSAAKQTFLIGKCGSLGYVPTAKSERAVGYSGGVNVGKLGHEGGFLFCDEIVDEISRLFK